MKKTFITILSALLLTSCGGSNKDKKEAKEDNKQEVVQEVKVEEKSLVKNIDYNFFVKNIWDLENYPDSFAYEAKLPCVIDFYADWCGPCKKEMPDFQEKFQELGDDVIFLMVNMTDGSRETVEAASEFIAEQGYTFPVYYDSKTDAATKYNVSSIPATYFIDKRGNLIVGAKGAINSATLQKGIDMIKEK